MHQMIYSTNHVHNILMPFINIKNASPSDYFSYRNSIYKLCFLINFSKIHKNQSYP